MPTDNRELTRGHQEVTALLGLARVAENEALRDLQRFLKLIGGEEGCTTEYARQILADRRRAVANTAATTNGLQQIVDLIERHVDTADARARVAEYLRQRARMTGIDTEEINGVHGDPEAEMAYLTVTDLKAVAGLS